MKLIQIAFLTGLMLITTTALGAKKEKVLICHVGSDVGAAGEVYLDDPDCVPGDTNDYFCPDAGKIDLIVVSKNAKHIGNKAHTFDGFADYEPGLVGASGEGTEDSNGDGIDDGCEPAEACPCWEQRELMSVEADSIDISASCETISDLPSFASIQNNIDPEPGVEGGFLAFASVASASCMTRDLADYQVITPEEGSACINQIAARCAGIGHPITP